MPSPQNPFRRPNGRIDWKKLANLLSSGVGLHAAAIAAGCSPDRIRRNFRRSRRFRFWIADVAASRAAETRIQLAASSGAAADALLDPQAFGALDGLARQARPRRAAQGPKSGAKRDADGPDLARIGSPLAPIDSGMVADGPDLAADGSHLARIGPSRAPGDGHRRRRVS